MTAFGQFSVPDLSSIARSLDDLERVYNEDQRGRGSGNMDDTGMYPMTRDDLLGLPFPRFLLVAGFAESPWSLGSRVCVTAEFLKRY